VHNKQVVWAFFTKTENSALHSKHALFFLILVLKFLNSKPNTLQSILMTEKDKTDRQKNEFSVQDMTVESLNTYNDYFAVYKEIIDAKVVEIFDEYWKTFGNFQGFMTNSKGDCIVGTLPGPEALKEVIITRGKRLKSDYRNTMTVSGKKRTLK
jgi:hypothetical protein